MWVFHAFLLLYPAVAMSGVIQFDPALWDIVDPNASMTLLAEQAIPFAHEGPVWIADANEVYFTSNRFVDAATGAQRIDLNKINLNTNIVSKVETKPPLLMGNGGILFSKHQMLYCSQGYQNTSAALFVIDTQTLAATKLNLNPTLDFTSLNDVIISDLYDGYFFTDPYYGYVQGFRPVPTLEQKIYFADRKTLTVNPVITFSNDSRPNGLVQSLDGSILYVSDTGFAIGNGTENPSVPRAIYAFDLAKGSNGIPVLSNKRFFVQNVDTGIPDQIKLDEKGNLYAAVGDGVNIYSPAGKFLGKLAVTKGGSVPSFQWAGKTLIILADTTIHSVPMKVASAPLQGLGNKPGYRA